MADIGPGSIVVCVVAPTHPYWKPLTVGARYVVREVIPMTEAWQGTHKGPGITLHGIVNMPLPNNPYEPTYWLEWFRPIDDGDAEIFREMISIKKREPAHG